MEIKIIDKQMEEKWEDYVAVHPYSIAWQSYEWSNVLKKNYKSDFFPIAACDGHKICGILPLYHLKPPFSHDLLISVPYAVAGGIVADSDVTRNLLLEKAIEISRQYNSCRIILKQYKIKVEGELQTDGNFYNRELDISGDIGALWDTLDDRNKEKIEEAAKQKPILDYPSKDIDSFYTILLNHHHRSGIPCASKKWIRTLVASKMYSFALLKHGNNVVAGTMLKEFKKTVSFPLTCMVDSTDNSMLFAYSLYWQLIKLYASKGFKIAHSGRIPNNDDTYAYRLGWGGDKHNYYYQYYPASTSKTEFSTKRGRKRKVFEECWKKLPRSVVRLIGPQIVKRFP